MNISPGVWLDSGGQWHTRLKLGLRKAPTLRSSVHGGDWSIGVQMVGCNLFFAQLGDDPNWQVTSLQAESNQVGIGKLVNSDNDWLVFTYQETGSIKLLPLRPTEKVTAWVFVSASAMDNPQFKREFLVTSFLRQRHYLTSGEERYWTATTWRVNQLIMHEWPFISQIQFSLFSLWESLGFIHCDLLRTSLYAALGAWSCIELPESCRKCCWDAAGFWFFSCCVEDFWTNSFVNLFQKDWQTDINWLSQESFGLTVQHRP